MRQSPRLISNSTDRCKQEETVLKGTGGQEFSAEDQAKQYVLDFARRIQGGEARAFDFMRKLSDRESIKLEYENTWTRMYRAIFETAREHPELTQELREMAGMIAQNPQMIHPRHLLDIASDYVWDPRINSYLKGDIVHSLGYAMRFFEESDYEGAIADKLDFTNTEHFSDTAHFLEFMQNLYNIGDEYSYGDNVVISRVHEALRQAVEKKRGSYLLNVRAQELLAEMDGRSWVASGFDRMPFMITKDRYARHKEDGLYISAPDEREHIAQLVGEFEALEGKIQPPQHLVDEAIAFGGAKVWWMPDQRLMWEREALYEEIDNAFTHRLTYDELVQDGAAAAPDGRAVEEHDFSYLQRKPIREIIKRDFEIEISNLSLQDQYKLLRFLKTVEYGKATRLLLEATRAMWKAGVKDYLGEIRGGTLEEVVGGTFSSGDIDVMKQIQGERYRGKYKETLLNKLRQQLSEAFQNPDSRFYIYRKNGKIVSFLRFDSLSGKGEPSKHMCSFMVNPEFEGGALGQALLEAALQKEIKEGLPIIAECDPELVKKYQEFGFQVLETFVEDGAPTVRIGLFPSSNVQRKVA